MLYDQVTWPNNIYNCRLKVTCLFSLAVHQTIYSGYITSFGALWWNWKLTLKHRENILHALQECLFNTGLGRGGGQSDKMEECEITPFWPRRGWVKYFFKHKFSTFHLLSIISYLICKHAGHEYIFVSVHVETKRRMLFFAGMGGLQKNKHFSREEGVIFFLVTGRVSLTVFSVTHQIYSLPTHHY